MIVYILIGIFVLAIAYIFVLYFINSKKMKKQEKKVETPSKDKEKKDDKKVEVESTISSKTPIEQAILEENSKISNNEVEMAFKQIEAQRQAYLEMQNSNPDNDEYLTELERSLNKDFVVRTRRKHMRSETAKIGKEGPSQKQIDEVNKEIAEEEKKPEVIDKTLANEIENMSPELKAILLNDILNKKY